MSSLGRTLFVVPLEGEPPEEPPKNDVTMATHDWSDVLDEMDLLFWANDRLLQKGMNYSQRILLATTVAYIASWDFDIAMRLLDEKSHVILSPCEMLRSVAEEKGWTLDTPVDWQLWNLVKVWDRTCRFRRYRGPTAYNPAPPLECPSSSVVTTD